MTSEEIAKEKLSIYISLAQQMETPMTLIISSLHSLIKEDADPHRQGLYETMRRNVERMLKMHFQMLDLERLENGLLKMHMCETDLIGYVDNLCRLFDHQSKAKMIVFNFEHDMQLLPVWIDRENFDKAIVNLIYNAFKYTPVGGTINLRVEQDDDHVYITMRDNGVGIPEYALPYIFNRFYEAHLSIEEHNIATDIGLDVITMIVKLHHGTIEAHNNEDGLGCEFRITLPKGCDHLSPEELLLEKQDIAHSYRLIEEEAMELPTAVDLKKQDRQRIVVVEDDPDVRDFLVGELMRNFDVTACTNGREGLAAVGRLVPDLVISDVRMPEMDGYALCSRIKNNSATSHIPVIMLTTNNSNEDRLEGIEANADAYVAKPFNMDVLRRIINNLLHRYRMLKLKYGRNDQLEELVDDVEMKSPDDQLLERIMAVINRNLGNSDLCVDNLTAEIGISRGHLHRKMKELTGQTPHDFIRSIRLKLAAQLLSTGDKNVTDVMYACGFASASAFSTVFKKFYGVSPREYMTEKRPKQ